MKQTRNHRRLRETDDAWVLLEDASKLDYPLELVSALHALADADNISALNVLSWLHEEGLRTSNGTVRIRQDRSMRYRFNRRAAALGDAGAMTAIADRLAQRDSTFAEAVTLYRRAFRKGYETAAYNLAVSYLTRGEYRRSVLWFERAYKAGDESALMELARAQLYGLGTRRNVRGAFAKLEKLARSKNVYIPANWFQGEAMMIMADALVQGWLVPRDYERGMRWLKRAAELGSSVAKSRLECAF